MDKPELLTREQVKLLAMGQHPKSFEYAIGLTCLHYMDEAERLRKEMSNLYEHCDEL